MTLRWMDSMGLGDLSLRYPGEGGTRITSGTRFPGVACIQYSGSDITEKAIPATATVVTGAAASTSPGAGIITFSTDAGATRHLSILYKSDGVIEVRRGTASGTILASASTGQAHQDTWNYIEVKATIADAGGIVQVRMNGSATPLINFTGDTRNGGTSTLIDTVGIGGASQCRWADWYILDTAGSAPNNDFLGDVRVYVLQPTGSGNYSQLVGSDGNSTDNYLLVDEAPYSTADYVGSATIGQKDSYAMADLPAGVSQVFGVMELAIVAKSDAGAAGMKQLLRVSGTDYTTAALALSTSYGEMVNLRDTNPFTGVAWTPGGVNGIEAGVEVA